MGWRMGTTYSVTLLNKIHPPVCHHLDATVGQTGHHGEMAVAESANPSSQPPATVEDEARYPSPVGLASRPLLRCDSLTPADAPPK